MYNPQIKKDIEQAISRSDDLDLEILRKEYLDSPNMQTANPYEIILSLFWQANFAKSDDEKRMVAHIFCQKIFEENIIPSIPNQLWINPPRFKEFAENSLVTLSLFGDYMKTRHGKSGIKNYRNSAVYSLEKIGRFDIARNFDAWLRACSICISCLKNLFKSF